MVFSFAACSGEAPKDLDLSAIKTTLLEKAEGTTIEFDAESFTTYYGIESEKIKQNYSYLVQTEALVPDEIVLVEATNEESAKAIEEALKSQLEQKISQLTGYDEKSLAVAKGTTIHRDGNYVAMFFSQQREEMEKIYNSHF